MNAGRLSNGLYADRFVALVDVAPELAGTVLDALRRSRIAAYAEPAGELRRVHVAAAELTDARPVARSALRTAGAETAWHDPLESVDTEAMFADLIAGWQVDTVAAVRAAERDLSREDAQWRARLELPEAEGTSEPEGTGEPEEDDPDDHYVPPPPPPLPRLAVATVGALVVLALAVLVLVFGGRLGLASDITLLLGVAGILIGAGMLVMRLRDRPDDEDDDGAVI